MPRFIVYIRIVLLLILVISVMALLGCGDIKVKTKDSNHTATVSGTSYSYVVIKLEPIEQIKQLCRDKYNQITDPNEFNRTVADCTFQNLSILNIDMGAVRDVQSDLCTQNPATLSPDTLAIYNALCTGGI